MVTLHTNFGDIKIKLFTEKAPITCENFLSYCKEGFYNNTIFHRVINGFMIQGGGMNSGLEEKITKEPIKNEANNGLSNKVGTIAMARTMDPHSASSQFFINVNDNEGWGYCVFGEVVEGMEVVNKIKEVETSNAGYVHQDVPVNDVIINNVSVN